MISQASRPLKTTKCSIVVSDTLCIFANSVLSHPITEISAGTLYFSSLSASRIPNAIISFNPTIAVISLCSLKSSFVRSYPILYSESIFGMLISIDSFAALMITLPFNPTASNSFRNPSTLFERCFCLVVRGVWNYPVPLHLHSDAHSGY